MTKKWIASLFGAAAMLLSGAAVAQMNLSGLYVGGEVGMADFGPDDDLGIKLLGGYQLHPNFAAEFGYGMMYDKGGTEVNTLELVGVGTFPVANQISVLGKLGFANVDVDPGDRKTEITWGIGAQYDFNRNLGVRALWQRYETDPEELDFLAIGVVYKF